MPERQIRCFTFDILHSKFHSKLQNRIIMNTMILITAAIIMTIKLNYIFTCCFKSTYSQWRDVSIVLRNLQLVFFVTMHVLAEGQLFNQVILLRSKFVRKLYAWMS